MLQRSVVDANGDPDKAIVDTQQIRGALKELPVWNDENLLTIKSDFRHVASIAKVGSSYYFYKGADTEDVNWGNTGNWSTIATFFDVGNGSVTTAVIDSDGDLQITLTGGATLNAGPVVGDQGPQGEQGIKGDTGDTGAPGSGVTIKNTLTIAQILAVQDPVVGDMYIASATGTSGGMSVTAGDGIVFTGSWTNVGPIRGPEGEEGPQGSQGESGENGAPGNNGAAATVSVGTTTTLAAGSQATVTQTGTSAARVFNFGIPRGADGSGGSGGGGGTLSAALTIDTTVGNLSGGTYAAGTSIETILRDIFEAPYQAPPTKYISSGYLRNGSTSLSTSITKNYGQSITFDRVHWSTGGTTGTPTATTIYAEDETPYFARTLNDSSSPATFASATIKMPYSGFASNDHKMHVKLNNTKGDGTGGGVKTVCTITYKTPKYFGGYGSNLSSPTTALINSLAGQDTNWNTSKGQTFIGNSSTNTGYMYIAYPAYYGALTSFQTSAAPGVPQLSGLTQISSNFSYTVNGQSITLRVYKSYNSGICTPGTTVTIG